MKTSQWVVLGIGFYILGMLFMNISLQAGIFCEFDFESNAIACIRQQAFSVFPYIFFLLGTVCFINGSIESWSKKKK